MWERGRKLHIIDPKLAETSRHVWLSRNFFAGDVRKRRYPSARRDNTHQRFDLR